MSVELIPYDSLVTKFAGDGLSLLLGNGFSQGCEPSIFSYQSLFENADFTQLSPEARDVFTSLDTTDFEAVIKTLQECAILIKIYQGEEQLIQKVSTDSEELKRLLVKTIADHHPSQPADILDAKFSACRAFLKTFKRIYTLNYDLLLYWTIMHSHENGRPPENIYDDGFRDPGEDEPTDYVVYEGRPRTQTLFYLHGALHLFEGESELKKFTWVRTGVRLTTQIREALNNRLYPLIVAEGKSKQKRGKIMRSEYLSKGFRSLRECRGVMFVFGASLGESDKHIVDAVNSSSVRVLCVSIYGDSRTAENKRLVDTIESLRSPGGKKRSREIYYFPAEATNIWG